MKHDNCEWCAIFDKFITANKKMDEPMFEIRSTKRLPSSFSKKIKTIVCMSSIYSYVAETFKFRSRKQIMDLIRRQIRHYFASADIHRITAENMAKELESRIIINENSMRSTMVIEFHRIFESLNISLKKEFLRQHMFESIAYEPLEISIVEFLYKN